MKLTPLAVLNKPDFRAPCNGCGYCCHEALCDFAETHLENAQAPCPALEWNGSRFVCGAMVRPHHYLGISWPEADELLIPMVKTLLGEGQGCSCPNPS